MKRSATKQILLQILSTVLLAIFLTVLIYVLYISLQYSRIEDNKNIKINNNQSALVKVGEDYTISTYNIGFGAYSQDFSFFMDTGETLSGKKTYGNGSVAKDLKTVKKNTSGAVNTIYEQNVDFALFQEVDVKATRSHKYNQYKHIQNKFASYSSSISMNFHSAFLFYPFANPHGKTDAGIVTLSKYNINSAIRRSLPIDESFPTKFFDLDRCIQITRLPISENDKELVIINAHLSAYDKGGKIRKKQLKLLNEILTTESAKENYVIVGGDFNHDIAGSSGLWESNFKKPEWVYELSDSNLAKGYRFVAATNAPTCRATDVKYVKGETYVVVIDGFICSSNIETIRVENIDNDFQYSDHNPALLKFRLK